MWRLIETDYNTGSMNMAIDEALLNSKEPVLRFYGWKPAGLSIGYFQSTNNFNFKNLKKYKIDLVRRLTGGNAVLHDKELTYSVIIDVSKMQSIFEHVKTPAGVFNEKQMPLSIIESYKMISKGLLQGLKNMGLNPIMNEDVKKEQKSAVCFNDPSWYEILVNNKKIVGSAQKRINGKILQHGAVLIDIDVEKYCSLFNNCSEKLIEKVKNRMTSINDEIKIDDKNPNNKNGFDGFPSENLQTTPEGATPGLSRHCCWGFDKRKNPAMDGWIFSNNKVNYQIVKNAMIKGFEKALGIEFEESELTEKELKLAKKLESNKYSTDKWNYLR